MKTQIQTKKSGGGFLFFGKAMTSIDKTNQGDTSWSTIIFFEINCEIKKWARNYVTGIIARQHDEIDESGIDYRELILIVL